LRVRTAPRIPVIEIDVLDAHAAASAGTLAAEELAEQVPEVEHARAAGATRRVRVRRPAEVGSEPAGANRVVLLSLAVVSEDVVRARDLLEALLLRLVAARRVRVVRLGELAVRLL